MKDANNQRFTPFGIFSRSIGLAPGNMKKEEEQNIKPKAHKLSYDNGHIMTVIEM